MGIDTELIWDKSKAILPVALKSFLISVKDQVVKIFLSAHSSLLEGFREQVTQVDLKPRFHVVQVSSNYSGYKLVGCDILIDSKFEPHFIGTAVEHIICVVVDFQK